jgi:hypothetical protein
MSAAAVSSPHSGRRPEQPREHDPLAIMELTHPARQPKTIPTRTNGQSRQRSTEVGFAVPRLLDLYGWLHESPGKSILELHYHNRREDTRGGLIIQLANTEEIENGKSNGALGEVFIRCNNVLYIG